MTRIRLTEINDLPTVVLPSALAEKLGAQPGDELVLVETEKGIEIQRCCVSADQQLELAKQIMAEDEQVLRKLAE